MKQLLTVFALMFSAVAFGQSADTIRGTVNIYTDMGKYVRVESHEAIKVNGKILAYEYPKGYFELDPNKKYDFIKH